MQYKVILKYNCKICSKCLQNKYHLNLRKLVLFKPNKHTLSQKWLSKHHQQQKSQQQQIQTQQQLTNQQSNQIQNLQSNIYNKSTLNSRYTRYEHDFNQNAIDNQNKILNEIQCNQYQSNRWKNNINFELTSDADCKRFTGFDRDRINFQAKKCSINPLYIFHARIRIRQYLSYELHAMLFGISATKLTQMIHEAFQKLEKHYAKSVLINSSTSSKQYWTREKIKQNTPKFVYQIQCIDPQKQDIIVLNQDSTYQYTETVQTNHDIRKKTRNGHKHRQLVKVHIWAATNGLPVYQLSCCSDGRHSDGHIWEAAMSEPFVKHCLQTKDYKAFKSKEICQELLYLQSILQFQDHAIMDNGYKIGDPRHKAPLDAPDDPIDDKRVSVLAASHKRSIVFIRQTQERINKWIKSNKFCRTEINTNDIQWTSCIWNICLADMIYENVILMKDSKQTQLLAKRILDLRNVAINPADIWIKPLSKTKTTKKPNKKSSESESDTESETDCDSNTDSESDCDALSQTDTRDGFQIKAKGWTKISEFLSNCHWLKELLVDILNISKEDIENFIGKEYQIKLATAYLRECLCIMINCN